MNDRVFVQLEEAALGALADYHAYRTYQGDNPDYYKRARLGIPVLSTYGRVRGTRANERQLDIIERRIASGDMTPDLPGSLAGHAAERVIEASAGGDATGDGGTAGTARRTPRKS